MGKTKGLEKEEPLGFFAGIISSPCVGYCFNGVCKPNLPITTLSPRPRTDGTWSGHGSAAPDCGFRGAPQPFISPFKGPSKGLILGIN